MTQTEGKWFEKIQQIKYVSKCMTKSLKSKQLSLDDLKEFSPGKGLCINVVYVINFGMDIVLL